MLEDTSPSMFLLTDNDNEAAEQADSEGEETSPAMQKKGRIAKGSNYVYETYDDNLASHHLPMNSFLFYEKEKVGCMSMNLSCYKKDEPEAPQQIVFRTWTPENDSYWFYPFVSITSEPEFTRFEVYTLPASHTNAAKWVKLIRLENEKLIAAWTEDGGIIRVALLSFSLCRPDSSLSDSSSSSSSWKCNVDVSTLGIVAIETGNNKKQQPFALSVDNEGRHCRLAYVSYKEGADPAICAINPLGLF